MSEPRRTKPFDQSQRSSARSLRGESADDTSVRLAQVEALLAQQGTLLQQLVTAMEEMKGKLPARRETARGFPAIDLVPMTDAEMQIGGQYMFRVANPRKPFYARAMVLGTTTDPKSGATLYRFVRADTSRKFQPRLASEFFKLPKDWKDPVDDTGEDEEELPATRTSRAPARR
jgi:hypothetical protein